MIFASFLPFGRCAAENCVGNVKILECAKISALCFLPAVGVLGGCLLPASRFGSWQPRTNSCLFFFRDFEKNHKFAVVLL